MPSVETQFPATADAPQSARAFLRAALQTWQLDGFGQVTELLTDELVANVVRHVGSPLTLRATTEGATLRIEVDDPSTEPPVLRHPDVHEDRGRGILLVDALATQWGSEIHSDGKTVWFEIDVSTATEEIHGSD
jgi:anti-sigma regulatory factor (Ser/Thr protein kinase)